MDPDLERFRADFERRHAPRRGAFALLPLGGPPPLEPLRRAAAEAFRLETRILPPLPLPRPGPLESRSLLDFVADRLPDGVLAVLAVTGEDLFAPGRPWVFGESSLRSGAGVCSLRRLAHPDPDRVLARARRLVVHEGGHLLALPHCRNAPCVMQECPDLEDLDRLPLEPCPADRRKLEWLAGALGGV